MFQILLDHLGTFRSQLLHDRPDVDGIPGDHRVYYEVQASRLVILVLRLPLAELAVVGKEEETGGFMESPSYYRMQIWRRSGGPTSYYRK